MTSLKYFFHFFKTSSFQNFWLVPWHCLIGGYPLCWGEGGGLSLPYVNHSIPFINTLFFKIYHLLRKIATISQLIKTDNPSIHYSAENNIVLILGNNFTVQENIALFVMFTNKFFSRFRKCWCLYFFLFLNFLFTLAFAAQQTQLKPSF